MMMTAATRRSSAAVNRLVLVIKHQSVRDSILEIANCERLGGLTNEGKDTVPKIRVAIKFDSWRRFLQITGLLGND